MTIYQGTNLNQIIQEGKKYQIILADPPWEYKDKAHSGNRGVSYKYPTMKIKDIKALPVNDISADNCTLFLWVTWPHLQTGLDVIKSWDFCYKTIGFVWVKLNKVSPTIKIGMGHYSRSNTEICLLATKGKVKRIDASISSVICTQDDLIPGFTVIDHIRQHSRKPFGIHNKITDLFGDLPKIELFARESQPEWDIWGLEPDKF